MTAEPEILHHPLHSSDSFLVLATDGLYDCLSSQEIVNLVGGALDATGPTLAASNTNTKGFGSFTYSQRHPHHHHHPQQQQQQQQLLNSSQNQPPLPQKPSSQEDSEPPKLFVYKDESLATHLIRNALGGGWIKELNSMLILEKGKKRERRDDITVSVIVFNGGGSGVHLKNADEAKGKLKESEMTPLDKSNETLPY